MIEHLFLVVMNELVNWIPRDTIGYLVVVYFTIYFMEKINKDRKN